MIRASIHTTISLILIAFMSLFSLNNISSSSSELSTAAELDENYSSMLQKLETAPESSKTQFINVLLNEEKSYYSSFSTLTFSSIEIFNAFLFISCYTILMQLIYLSFMGLTKDADRSAVLHCVSGFVIIYVYSLLMDSESLTKFVDKSYLYFVMGGVSILLVGTLFKSRISSLTLILFSLYFAYLFYSKNGYVGYQILLLALSIDAGYSIFSKRLTRRSW